VTVAVETTVDPYLTLNLESTAVQVSPQGDELSSKALTSPGSLYFGERFETQINEPPNTEHPFSTSYKTVVTVTVINNSKPFLLKLLFIPVENQKSLLDLKMADTYDSALNVKTAATQKTKFAKNIEALNVWTPYPATGEFILYDSKNEVSSDQFTVSFALKRLYTNTPASQYSGKIMWIVSSTM
jgi:hypothetical protein